MRPFWKKLVRSEQGSTIVLAGLSLTLLLTAAGLVVDGGTLYVMKARLQKAANAAVLSGAQKLTAQQSDVQSVVNQILNKNNELTSLLSTDIQMKSSVRAILKRDVTLGFGRLFGYSTAPVSVQAAAQIAPLGKVKGAVPIGIEDYVNLSFNTTYTLKFDAQGVVAGGFGILALDGPGAKTYLTNLSYGYGNYIYYDEIINTQTGNVAGDTRTAIQYRINSSPYMPGDMSHPDDPRRILIPVYHDVPVNGNQTKQIQVKGFAIFYIQSLMTNNDTEINGVFIQGPVTGYTMPDAVDRGAYAIRLAE